MVYNNVCSVCYVYYFCLGPLGPSHYSTNTFPQWVRYLFLANGKDIAPLTTLIFMHKYYESVTSLLTQRSKIQDWVIPIFSYLIEIALLVSFFAFELSLAYSDYLFAHL